MKQILRSDTGKEEKQNSPSDIQTSDEEDGLRVFAAACAGLGKQAAVQVHCFTVMHSHSLLPTPLPLPHSFLDTPTFPFFFSFALLGAIVLFSALFFIA